MLKVEYIKSFNWQCAIRGMRNPKESWGKSDSLFLTHNRRMVNCQGKEKDPSFRHCETPGPLIEPNDYKLAMSLIKAGSEHRKFLRQIFVSYDVIAPEYWWKEYETYQIGTTENSTSTMHKLGSRLLTEDDFEIDNPESRKIEVERINQKIDHWWDIKNYLGDNDESVIKVWRDLIQALPMSFKYRRTCTVNYEVIRNVYGHRKNHKLVEWHHFFDQLFKELPYPEFIKE